jgi:hypothetical protein
MESRSSKLIALCMFLAGCAGCSWGDRSIWITSLPPCAAHVNQKLLTQSDWLLVEERDDQLGFSAYFVESTARPQAEGDYRLQRSTKLPKGTPIAVEKTVFNYRLDSGNFRYAYLRSSVRIKNVGADWPADLVANFSHSARDNDTPLSGRPLLTRADFEQARRPTGMIRRAPWEPADVPLVRPFPWPSHYR